MARKKKHEEHVNHERWLVSYADFITLLFAFFVVLYSVSSVNEGKYRVLSDSMLASFRSPTKSLLPIQVGNPAKVPTANVVELPPTVANRVIDRKPRQPVGGAGEGAGLRIPPDRLVSAVPGGDLGRDHVSPAPQLIQDLLHARAVLREPSS